MRQNKTGVLWEVSPYKKEGGKKKEKFLSSFFLDLQLFLSFHTDIMKCNKPVNDTNVNLTGDQEEEKTYPSYPSALSSWLNRICHLLNLKSVTWSGFRQFVVSSCSKVGLTVRLWKITFAL